MIISERRIEARKIHYCDDCHLPISPGAHYYRLYGRAHAHETPYVIRTHERCRTNADPTPCPDCKSKRRWEVLPGGGINTLCLNPACQRRGCNDNLAAQRGWETTNDRKAAA